MNSIDNNYIYAQDKNIYQNELEADNQNKQNTFRVVYHDSIDDNVKEEDILKIYNPYIEDNLAFSLKMQLAATNTYPGFSRHIYLKGYRYNMHFCPKSLLVEVGAQTNTVQEAKNAMPHLAGVIGQVLGGR